MCVEDAKRLFIDPIPSFLQDAVGPVLIPKLKMLYIAYRTQMDGG